MKKIRIREKTLYSILWICTILAAGTVLFLTVFALSKRSHPTPTATDVLKTQVQIKGTSDNTPHQTLPFTPPTPTVPTVPTVPKDTSDPAGVDPIQFILPTDGTIVKTHNTETLSFSTTMNDYRTHSGIDIEADIGSAVFAAADGTLTGVYTDPLMGQCLEITHAEGYRSVYKNLSEELPEGITEGAFVKAGDLIAAVGESACIEIADEAHLHFELLLNDQMVDPCTVFDGNDDSQAET